MTFKIIAIVSAIALLLFSQNSVFAQKLEASNVPSVVAQAFSIKFPAAKRVKWELETANVYEADFRMAKEEYSATFDQNGGLLETEMELKTADLPPAVQQAVKSQFAGFKIEEVEKVTSANGTVVYELEVEKGKETFEVQFDTAGKMLKKEAKEEEEEDKD